MSESQQGEVSEVSGMDPADAETPISPGDATSGAPEGESGQPDSGPAGPNAIPDENEEDSHL
ncbi:hypothetical protein [Nocardioides piscis]|uniref:Uncharacterized protein n=1 Tax=Nocardioides piscis TaxID=2714938 RepID=A0A6G7YGR7_9ACTN|nr:hypothetical protein [Nocardioides piscis]QIK75807.1 hypothetical protein G7071_10495 [Nocardioides piscis]